MPKYCMGAWVMVRSSRILEFGTGIRELECVGQLGDSFETKKRRLILEEGPLHTVSSG